MSQKKCPTCLEVKDFAEFGKNKSRPDGLQNKCRSCRSTYQKEWYADEENRALHRDRDRGAKAANRREVLLRLREYFSGHHCVDCGEDNIVLLEFDHVDPSTKFGAIGTMVANGLNWARISVEIEKCEVRCVRCHRLKTAAQFGWWRTLES